MITIDGKIGNFRGTAKELTFEFIHLLLGFKQNLIKEFNLSEQEALEIIEQCGKIAYMNTSERTEFLNNLLSDVENGK